MKEGRSKIPEFSVMMSFNKRSSNSDAFLTETSESETRRERDEKMSGNMVIIDCRPIFAML